MSSKLFSDTNPLLMGLENDFEFDRLKIGDDAINLFCPIHKFRYLQLTLSLVSQTCRIDPVFPCTAVPLT